MAVDLIAKFLIENANTTLSVCSTMQGVYSQWQIVDRTRMEANFSSLMQSNHIWMDFTQYSEEWFMGLKFSTWWRR